MNPTQIEIPKSVSARRKIVMSLLVAFIIRIIATLDTAKIAEGGAIGLKKAIDGQNLIAWGVLVAMLALASDIDATADIAVAFALLILVAAMLSSGPDALKNLNDLVTSGKKVQKAQKASLKGKAV